MASGRGNFKSPLDILLSAYIRKIDIVLISLTVKYFKKIDFDRIENSGIVEKIYNFPDILHSINLKTLNHSGFTGIF